MALTVSRKAPPEEPPVKIAIPKSRLALVFRELAIDGIRTWSNVWVFCQVAADSGDQDCAAVMDCFRKLKKKERKKITPEAACSLVGVDPEEFAASIFREYLRYSDQAANLIAAAGLPGVVRKSVQVAKTKDGHRDRRLQMEHSGFLPQRNGGGIHVNASASAENKSATVIQANELPTMETDSLRFTRILKDSQVTTIDGQRALPPGVPALGNKE